MATKKKAAEPPKPDTKKLVKKLQEERKNLSAQDKVFTDQLILEITKNS